MFDIDTQNKIIDMYKNKIGIDNIIKTFDTTEREIRKVLKENKIDRGHTKNNLFEQELKDRIIYLYFEKKYTQSKICHELLISDSSITKEIKKRGLKSRSYSESNRRFFRNQNYFDKINTPNKAYVLGLLFADGCNNLEHNSITLSLQEEDFKVVEFVKKQLEYTGNIRINRLHDKNENYKNQCVLVINDEYMSKKLEEKGMVNAKSLVLEFPRWLNKSLYPYFIRGYFDGDSCVSYDEIRNKWITKTAGTYDMISFISNILTQLGINNHFRQPKQSIGKILMF